MVNNLTFDISERLRSESQSSVLDVGLLAEYVELLRKWNRKINLTSLGIDPPTKDAIDRLIVEPVNASRFVEHPDVRIVDLGTGGGSPAIPFRIQLPDASLRMVESRSRKCAFLREAVRTLGLKNAEVEESRFEFLTRNEALHSSADLITLRAVRLDDQLVALIRFILTPNGKVYRFVNHDDLKLPTGLASMSVHPLVSSRGSVLQIAALVDQ